ncbi:MAG: Asp-tRNA(Asn)/Glu-tRNA(Gln) amidotransferase subunit GatA, partial [Cyanobacteria bacterium]|nr:Asp-tRNA(Asn)/Glu-tRNA(Gln) amidotransferase subunit GatA [Cyanobacteriota bacterium]
LSGYISPYDAHVIEKLKTQKLVMVGKTNLDEFAMGSSTENSALQKTHNPWDLSRVPGGSSGGSAATVASGQVPLSLGSDTGGSVRQPASLCGIVGVKPTYGMVSRFGLVAFASSLDQVSPFARNVTDAAALLQMIAGFDPKDSTSLTSPSLKDSQMIDFISSLEKLSPDCLKNKKIGVIEQLDGTGMQPEVQSAFQASLEAFQKMGATLERISIPSIQVAVASYYIIATAEASSNLARFDGVRYGLRTEKPLDTSKEMDIRTMYSLTRANGFGAEVKRRIMLGTFCLSSGFYDAYYGKAQKVRQLLAYEFHEAWKKVDFILTPTSPTTAFPIGEKSEDPIQMYLSDIATIPANLIGIPGISIPCGFDQHQLPIGLQLLGPHWSENLLFQAARCFEMNHAFQDLMPTPLVGSKS